MSGSKSRWRISFHIRQSRPREPPKEFLCPISNCLMAEPVILSSGQSFERRCIEAALSLPHYDHHLLFLSDTTAATLIPNVALKTAIGNWCRDTGVVPPSPPDTETATRLAYELLAACTSPQNAADVETPAAEPSSAFDTDVRVDQRNPSKSVSKLHGNVDDAFSDVQLNRIDSPDSVLQSNGTPSDTFSEDTFKSSGSVSQMDRLLDGAERPVEHSTSSEANVFEWSGSGSIISDPALHLGSEPTRPSDSSLSASLSSDSDLEWDGLIKKMRSAIVSDQEEAVVSIRNMSRDDPDIRARMCSRDLLTCLRVLMTSRYAGVQVNSVAALVNLSLQKLNKVKIVRSGLVPALIDVLKGGHVEAQEHAAGAIFSLALDDENKTALGVLGAVPPLVHLLGSSRGGQARLETTMALYHLSLARGNHARLIRAGALVKLVALARGDEPDVASRAMLILCNVAASSEGRAVMLDSNALSVLIGLVAESWHWEKEGRLAEVIRGQALIALCLLTRDSWRFKGLAREAGAEGVIAEVAKRGCGRDKEWAGKLLMVMKGCTASSLVSSQAGGGDDESVAPARLHEQLISELNSTDF